MVESTVPDELEPTPEGLKHFVSGVYPRCQFSCLGIHGHFKGPPACLKPLTS